MLLMMSLLFVGKRGHQCFLVQKGHTYFASQQNVMHVVFADQHFFESI
jgi:hypothetical protein